MELDKARQGGALVKHTETQDKIAVSLGVAGIALLWLPIANFFGLAAGIGAMLLSWDSATSRDKRTLAATAAFTLGAIPLALKAVGLVGWAFHGLLVLMVIAAVVGGAFWGISALRSSGRRDEEPVIE